MKLPARKGKPKLPPTPRGGGAAARQRQFELERGMPDTPDCVKPTQDTDKKKQK